MTRRESQRTPLPPVWVRAIDGWREHLHRKELAESTVAGYLLHVEWLAVAVGLGVGVGTPWSVTSLHIGEWVGAQSWSEVTRRKVLVSLRAFYAWAVGAGHLEWAPTAGVPRSQPRRPGPTPKRAAVGWWPSIEQHLTSCRARAMRPGSVEVRRHYLTMLAEVSADPWRVTTTQLEAWLANPEWGPATKKSARTQVREFYRWSVREGLIDASPADPIEPVRVPRGLPRPANDATVREALAGADERIRLMLLLGAHAGLRVSEIAGLVWSNVTTTRLIVTGKGGHTRLVPIAAGSTLSTALAAARRRQERGEHARWSESDASYDVGTWVFPSSQGGHLTGPHVGKLMRGALPGDVTAHQLRHRFATRAYGATRDLRAVQELLGHAMPETTARYAAVADGALLAAVVGAGE
ncbi:tyrosine-type recombinase/integrase [Nocardioides sp. L-11A]|uniref:tyrosine-type recombinase/integrase n=1 Tax=Nocardioides sp. L-11A TaxID=3043848 RepID=UPI00249ACEBD|nr:tyrosine-type recombinase/integrase [Nocardioides sp. L-11A]